MLEVYPLQTTRNVWFNITVVLLLITVPFTMASNSSWSGCGPIDNPNQAITIGEKTVVCLQVGNSVDWGGDVQYVRLSFQPEVDQYSRFHVPNSFGDLVDRANEAWINRNITVGVASQQEISFLRVFYEFSLAGTGRVFPYLTAIIDVDKGRVRGVTWDDACIFCGGFDDCPPITYDYNGVLQTQESAGQPVGGCPKTLEECVADTASCDLLLYVVWSGTDSKGNAFQSAASRYSMFPSQDIKNRLTQAANSAADAAGAGDKEEGQ